MYSSEPQNHYFGKVLIDRRQTEIEASNLTVNDVKKK
jgi:hypothetical protein